MTEIIRCRARVSGACKNGQPTIAATGDPDYRMADDGTFNGRTVVCDPCYVALMPLTPSGQALTHELPHAIAVARDMHKPLPERARRFSDEAIAAGLTPTTVQREDGAWDCIVYERDGTLLKHLVLEEGKPPREERHGG